MSTSDYTSAEKLEVLPNTEFIETIRSVVEKNGQGLAPLIGSGVSAPSGILMGQDFTDFLGYTVFQVVSESWDIPRNGWPKYPGKDEVEKARVWLFNRFKEICKNDYKVSVTGHPHPEKGPYVANITNLGSPREPIQDVLNHLSVPLVPDILCHSSLYEAEKKRRELYEQVYRNHPSEDWQSPTWQGLSSIEFVQEKALRSLHDWRATLSFLSSVAIKVLGPGKDDKRAVIVKPDSSIIDSFNVHITRDKQPNLSHLMIAHLMRPLRTRVLLTTNFDSLLENSFANLKEPLQVLEVSSRGHLPSFRTVRSQNCLIKLHGSLSETRADYSLDEPPNEIDKETFAAYFCGERPSLPITSLFNGLDIGVQHLLVLGYSGRDGRTIQLIKHALDSNLQLQVFWICHSEGDCNRVNTLFNEASYRKAGKQRVKITVTDRPDLLLYELYQLITRSLPGGGVSFQYSPNVPPTRAALSKAPTPKRPDDPTSPGTTRTPRHVPPSPKDLTKDLQAIKKYIDGEQSNKPLVVSCQTGTTFQVGQLFDNLKASHFTPLWIELEDYSSPSMLLFELVQIMSLKLGYFQLDHVSLLPLQHSGELPRKKDPTTGKSSQDSELDTDVIGHHLDNLNRYLGLTPSRWPLFLYGRNGAGGCADFVPKYWNKKEFKELECLIQMLVKHGFRVIYFPYNQLRKEHDGGDGSVGIKGSKEVIEGLAAMLREVENMNPLQGKAKEEKDLFMKFRNLKVEGEQRIPSAFDIPVHDIETSTEEDRRNKNFEPAYVFSNDKYHHLVFDNPEESHMDTLARTLFEVTNLKYKDLPAHKADPTRVWLDLTRGARIWDTSKPDTGDTTLQNLRNRIARRVRVSTADDQLNDFLDLALRGLLGELLKIPVDSADPLKNDTVKELLFSYIQRKIKQAKNQDGVTKINSLQEAVLSLKDQAEKDFYEDLKKLVDASREKLLNTALHKLPEESFQELLNDDRKYWANQKQKKEDNLQKLQFLYGLTLFRQSRHLTALLTEATFRCPARFNFEGRDNNFMRYSTVDGWVKDLQDSQLLLTKPGGYNWCFRDTRLGLQSLLEELNHIPVSSQHLDDPESQSADSNSDETKVPEADSGDNFKSSEVDNQSSAEALGKGDDANDREKSSKDEKETQAKNRQYDFLGQARARTHYWIGDWYQKAFASTGHYIPLIESLYHRIETVRFAAFAKPAGLDFKSMDQSPTTPLSSHPCVPPTGAPTGGAPVDKQPVAQTAENPTSPIRRGKGKGPRNP